MVIAYLGYFVGKETWEIRKKRRKAHISLKILLIDLIFLFDKYKQIFPLSTLQP
jgi:hypothetical protein